jgi:hypothetical protein
LSLEEDLSATMGLTHDIENRGESRLLLAIPGSLFLPLFPVNCCRVADQKFLSSS